MFLNLDAPLTKSGPSRIMKPSIEDFPATFDETGGYTHPHGMVIVLIVSSSENHAAQHDHKYVSILSHSYILIFMVIILVTGRITRAFLKITPCLRKIFCF